MIEPVAAKEAKQPRGSAGRIGGGELQCLTAADPRLGVRHDILAAVLDVDRRQIGVGDEQAAEHSILALRCQRCRIGDDSEAGTHDDVEARPERDLAGLLEDSRQTEHLPGEVLVVVAIDILGVHGGRRDVVKRDAGDRADFPSLVLELVKQGCHDPAVVGDVHPVVVRLDPADHLGRALR